MSPDTPQENNEKFEQLQEQKVSKQAMNVQSYLKLINRLMNKQEMMKNRIEKRRAKNKVARRSRRVNRILAGK